MRLSRRLHVSPILFGLICGVWTSAVRADELPFPQLLKQAEEKSAKKEWGEAAKLWTRVVEANPVNGAYWAACGMALHSAKEYRRAIPAFQKALDLRANYPFDTAYNIACAHARLGEKEEALSWLQKSVDMGLRDMLHLKLDPDLESLHGDPRYKNIAGIVDASKLSRDEGWRTDLAYLYGEIKRKHFDPYRKVSREQMEAYVKKLDGEIPSLNDDQVTVGLIKLAQMAGDGHTHVRVTQIKAAPVQFYSFADGIFVTATTPEHTDLLGARLLKIGDHSTADVLKGVEPLVSHDNDMGILSTGPAYMRNAQMLHGLGLLPTADELPITVLDAAGTERVVKLPTDAGRPDGTWTTFAKSLRGPLPLYLKNRAAPYWFEYLPDSKVIYFQYNAVRNDPKESLDRFCERLFKFVNENAVEKLVIDLRWNGGGNTFLNQPIIHGLIKCEKINKPGKLFAIIGRQTFSAAQNCSDFIERHTNAIFAGEPSGSSPNFIGESVQIMLPYSKMPGTISDLYWQSSWPMDYRTWIAPTLYAPPTFAAYKALRDPAMEAVLAYKTEG